jgi:4-amino-4-deoxy-L-arabinose transferase-like glycosyltransferase
MHDVALLAGTLLTLVTGVCVAGASGLRSRLERLNATLVLAVAQIVATLLFAGLVLRSLSMATVLVLNLVVTAAAVAIAARVSDLPGYFRAEWAALRRVRIPRPADARLRNLWAWVLAAVATIETAYLALVVYVLPPAYWDALTYHLTAVASWLQGDRILITPLNLPANVNPMNGELVFLWIGSLTRSDLLIDGAQLAFAMIGAVAVAAIARTIGVSRTGSFAAASLYLLTPIVLAQATTNYVDLALPGLFLAGYAFLLRYMVAESRGITGEPGSSHGSLALLVLAGIGIGLATGSKLSGIMYGSVALLVLVANIVWWRRRTRLAWRACALRLGAFVLPILLLGSFWYIRTWVEYGNPTYPYRVELAGVTVFDGRSRTGINPVPPDIGRYPLPARSLASWARVPTGYTYDQRHDGFGPTWLFFELPALVIFAAYCALRRRMVLYDFIVPFVVIVMLTPYNWWTRFIVLIVAPGAVALVFLVERIRRRSIALVLQAAVIVAVVAGCALSSKRYTVSPRFTADAIVSRALDPRSERTLGKLVLPEYAWTDAVPEHSRVGVYPADVPNRFAYALFGTDFHNQVIALSQRELTATSLVRTLNKSRVDYFVTRRDGKRDEIAQANPTILELVSDVGDVRVYRVSPRPRAGS